MKDNYNITETHNNKLSLKQKNMAFLRLIGTFFKP